MLRIERAADPVRGRPYFNPSAPPHCPGLVQVAKSTASRRDSSQYDTSFIAGPWARPKRITAYAGGWAPTLQRGRASSRRNALKKASEILRRPLADRFHQKRFRMRPWKAAKTNATYLGPSCRADITQRPRFAVLLAMGRILGIARSNSSWRRFVSTTIRAREHPWRVRAKTSFCPLARW